MEPRKQQEIGHYDNLARVWREAVGQNLTTKIDIEKNEVLSMASYRFLYRLLEQYIPEKRVLDYGCGHGIHSIPMAQMGASEVYGIDLSEESLLLAKDRAKHFEINQKIQFLKMDAEALNLPRHHFDVVFDDGTFSSLNMEKAFSEIHRVLRPDGLLIGIETFGQHPLANLKRRLNAWRGIRTSWAAHHILNLESLRLLENFFEPVGLRFFHLASLLAHPFRNLPGGKYLTDFTDRLDEQLLKIPTLQKYAFKIVFVLKPRLHA